MISRPGNEAGRLLDATTNRPGDQATMWHAGLPLDLAGLVCIVLSERLIHGYDVAFAASRPWHIDPEHARLTLYGDRLRTKRIETPDNHLTDALG